MLNRNHELCLLAGLIKWDEMDKKFSLLFEAEEGSPAKPIRLMVGIMLLQNMYKLSDEAVVARWVENPYWQLFCGYDFLQWKFPIHPTTLTKWRKRMGTDALEKVLCFLIDTARVSGAVEESSFKKVIVDTTVVPKAIAHPCDAQLYLKSIKQLVAFAKKEKIALRQSYERLAPRACRNAGRLFHLKKSKQAMKEVRRLKSYCGRVYREILEASAENPVLQERITPVFFVIGEILTQTTDSKDKIYSLHEPKVECIAKGKANKKYEFGNKASLTVTHREGFVVGIQGLHGNPYDGHTLSGALAQAEKLTGQKIEEAFVYKGYKKHGVTDGKLGKNFLKGILGNQMHALFCGLGHNMRLLANFLKGKQRFCPG